MADNACSEVLHVEPDSMVVYVDVNGIQEDKENVDDFGFTESRIPHVKRKYEEDSGERNIENENSNLLTAPRDRPVQRRENFSDAEKCDIADIVCCEGLEHEDDCNGEKYIVRLRSRTTPNKFKKVLYEQIATRLERRGYRRRDSVSMKRMWNQLFGDYQKAVNFLKSKSDISSFKHKLKPWVITIYEAVKENHLCAETDSDDMETDNAEIIEHSHDGHDGDDIDADESDNEKGCPEIPNQLHTAESSETTMRRIQRKAPKPATRISVGHSIPSRNIPIQMPRNHEHVLSDLASSNSGLPNYDTTSLTTHGTDQLACAVVETVKGTSNMRFEEIKLLLNCYSQERDKDRELEREKLDIRKKEEEHKFIIEKMKMEFALKFGYLPAAGIAHTKN